MPGITRKIIIFATVNGLILQPSGGWESKKAICVGYGSDPISTQPKIEHEKYKSILHIESHGLIGKAPSTMNFELSDYGTTKKMEKDDISVTDI